MLQHDSLLLAADPTLPSVTSLVAGEPVRGSWWSHPRSRAMWAVMEALEDHEDVAVAKLVSGKVTYVHRPLWPALVAAGASEEAWQTRPLSPRGRRLWALVKGAHALCTDEAEFRGPQGKALRDAVRELEAALLVHGEEIHTAGGAHAKRLQTWRRWGEGLGLSERMEPPHARRTLERALARLNERFGGSGWLPWQRGSLSPEGAGP